MPIYEYYSPDTHRIYSFLARSPALAARIPRCPDGPQFRMEKRISRFSITSSRPESGEEGDADDPFAGLSDSEMERVMGELERDFAGMDEENPDPRQLGHLMRRFSQLTGKPLPGPLREMVDRLEQGEDPDALEEEYGDALDDEGLDWFSAARQLRSRLTLPGRDPKLYELADYLDDGPLTAGTG